MVRRAGRIIAAGDGGASDLRSALDILSAWRNLHTAPMQGLWDLLKRRIDKSYNDALLARRLKRYASIKSKLARFQSMGLDQMQDIGGLRVIMASIADIRRFHEQLCGEINHTPIIPPKDYIANPKADGYRGLHQVYIYRSEKRADIDGLRIEVQFRTRLQHAFATAVETLGIIRNAAYKSGEGDALSRRYFSLASALFALDENSPPASEFAKASPKELAAEIRELESSLQFASKIAGIAASLKALSGYNKRRPYHLLELDSANGIVNITPFNQSQLEYAEAIYRSREQDTADNPDITIVLAGAGELNALRAAYPNYFLDARLFIENLERILKSLA